MGNGAKAHFGQVSGIGKTHVYSGNRLIRVRSQNPAVKDSTFVQTDSGCNTYVIRGGAANGKRPTRAATQTDNDVVRNGRMAKPGDN